MPEYVIEREMPGLSELTSSQIREASLHSLAVLNELGAGIKWIRSYMADNKLYCIYSSPNPEMIKEHARLTGTPANRIERVRRLIDPAEFQQS